MKTRGRKSEYSEEVIQQAVKDWETSDLGWDDIAAKYGVPKTIIWSRRRKEKQLLDGIGVEPEKQCIKVAINNAKIKSCEVKTKRQRGGYLLVKYEDEAGEVKDLVDKNVEHQPLYVPRAAGTLYVEIHTVKQNDYVKTASINIADFKPIYDCMH